MGTLPLYLMGDGMTIAGQCDRGSRETKKTKTMHDPAEIGYEMAMNP